MVQTFGPPVVVDDRDAAVQAGEQRAVGDGEAHCLHGPLWLHHTVVERTELSVQSYKVT